MNIEDFRTFCMAKKGVTEEFPFDETTLVFKVMGKIFAMATLEGELSIYLKCDPELAIELREQYPAVQPGYHMSKKHWNTISIDGSIPSLLIFEWTDHSYHLVIKGLTKKLKDKLDTL